MTNIPPTPPSSGGPPSVNQPASTQEDAAIKDTLKNIPSDWYKGGPVDWLGMHFTPEEAGKLFYAIDQNISQQIEKDKAKSVKALRQMREDQQ